MFSTRDVFLKFTANSSILVYVFLLKYLPSCHPQDSGHDVGTRGLEKVTAFSRKTVRFAEVLHQSKYNN